MQAWLDGKSCFSLQMLPTFGGRCNRNFWDSQVANKIFQKWTVFVFSESLSRDQVMLRAYLYIIHTRHFIISW